MRIFGICAIMTFLCLSDGVHFNVDLFKRNLAFSNANMPLLLGFSHYLNILNVKNLLNRSNWGGHHTFSKMSKI